MRALPETFRAEAEKAASAVVLDPARWGGTAPSTPPHLEALQQAVIEGVQVRLGYTDAKGAVTERDRAPARPRVEGDHVVPGRRHRRRAAHVPRVAGPVGRAHRRAGRTAGRLRPRSAAWQEIVATIDERRGLRHVAALADPDMVRWLRVQFGTRLTVGAEGDDGRVDVDIGFPEHHDDPARELCMFAGGVEVLDPPEVRARLAEIGHALVARHAPT